MQELELTWGRVISVWWLLVWRTTLGAVVFGAVVGFVLGFVGVMAGVSMEGINILASVAGAIVGLLWGLVVARMALKKQYGAFRLALIPR